VNAAGDIVGTYYDANGGHGFLLHKGVFTSFDQPFGGNLTNPYAINKQGMIVGMYQVQGVNHGFVLNNGVFAQLDFPGAIDTDLYSINDNLDIVGDYTTDGATWHSFLMSGGNTTEIDVPFPGTMYTSATGINNHGQIVGQYGANGNNTFYSFGFLTNQ
jgi:uncharacterized membrane protein